MLIVETRAFSRRIDDLLSIDELRQLQLATECLLLLYAFAKNERADLTRAQVSALRRAVESEYP